ncbi:MAG: thioesterase [Rhodobacterales bacterium]|nr:MAG: thioesterase [Rhodobacterales bacterium]
MANPVSADFLHSVSGLEHLRLMLTGDVAPSPISQLLNYRLHSAEKGKVCFIGAPLKDHTNQIGILHGGWYSTLLDSAMACAIMSELPAGRVQNTLEFKVNLLKTIPKGMQVAATGTTLHVGRSTGVATGEIRGVENGILYASSSTTCLILDAK